MQVSHVVSFWLRVRIADVIVSAGYNRLMRTTGLFLLVFLAVLTAAGQQKKLSEPKPCIEHPGWCGIIAKFNPPLDGVLLAPNEVTVDVPLELHPIRVVVASYPLGTGVEGEPSEDFIEMRTFQKVGKYARFRGEITKCKGQDSLEVLVFCKGSERYPINAGVGGAMECRDIGSKTTDHPPPTK